MTGQPLPPIVASLLLAIEAHPDDLPLRLHAAALLLDHGDVPGAIGQCSAVLQQEPASAEAIDILTRATRRLAGDPAEVPAMPARPEFDWHEAEAALAVDADIVEGAYGDDDHEVEAPGLRLADIGGMVAVKRRLDRAFLAPMRNPELQRLYGKSLSGGLLLYGPPGCGKTFLARAVAGELGARFFAVSLAHVLDMWIGSSERNLHDVFVKARRNTPCVLFLDELDAIGQKRAHLRGNSAMRGVVNQLLTEMDSVGSDNEGVFVLGATNHPWDVDTALIRPGRFDRLLFVGPPDESAREAIANFHLRSRPLEGIDVRKVVKRTEHFSGADIAHVCDSAAELALEDSITSGVVRPITMRDVDQALKEVKPSTGPWLQDARNVVAYANEDGRFDELRDYLKERRMA
jgi:SpoVK/Ycf46/Vps4 family AAA+-type ATPase